MALWCQHVRVSLNFTGCFEFDWKLSNVNGLRTELVHFWPMFVKPKCVWEAVDFFEFSKICFHFLLFDDNLSYELPPLKYILSLPPLGQICTISELQPFTFAIFQTEHPVHYALIWLHSLFSEDLADIKLTRLLIFNAVFINISNSNPAKY